jgi:hypothetical protein
VRTPVTRLSEVNTTPFVLFTVRLVNELGPVSVCWVVPARMKVPVPSELKFTAGAVRQAN